MQNNTLHQKQSSHTQEDLHQGSSRLELALAKIREDWKSGAGPALMSHVVLGYPSLRESIDIVKAMVDGGASLVELQIPFSDPLADGPVIMRANHQALAQGLRPKDCMGAMEELSRSVCVPLLFMTYFNLVYSYNYADQSSANVGTRAFLRDAKNAGACGCIVPDVPPEESHEGFQSFSREIGLAAVPIVSPVSTESRLQKVAQMSGQDGFVYCVSTTGTTGVRVDLPKELEAYLSRVRKHFSQPIALGFGISSSDQVRELGRCAEIAVVGSATIKFLDALATELSYAQRLNAVSGFIRGLLGR